MGLPNSYTQKPNSISIYFDALLDAEAPERFTTRFLESLDFKSSNDRLFISILKELNFLDLDGVPTERYYKFLDRSRSQRVVADAIKEMYSELFAVNKNAHKLSTQEVKNKLRTLYSGTKKDSIIGKIAKTFSTLCEYADFSAPEKKSGIIEGKKSGIIEGKSDIHKKEEHKNASSKKPFVTLDSLQYHINIVLPDTRDQAVYDAIFKSLRDHLK